MPKSFFIIRDNKNLYHYNNKVYKVKSSFILYILLLF